MIIPVIDVENSGIHVQHESLHARRYRYDLSIEQSPRNLIILLRVGEFSRSGHYMYLDFKDSTIYKSNRRYVDLVCIVRKN